ncbi:MAG: transcriptional regulator [Phycisphaerae bacterium]
MDEVTFQNKLSELMAQIDTLPEGERDRIRAIAAETKQRHADIRKSVDQMQESLDFLRLWIKYLLFDLEATRRENQYLRKMLEQDPGNSNQNPGGESA